MWPFTNIWPFSRPDTPLPCPEFDQPWRTINWSESSLNLLSTLNNFQPGNSEVDTLRILLHGPIGAGKSSFINTVDSALQGRITTRALTDTISGMSFTLKCKTYTLSKDKPDSYYPFTFTDVMGIGLKEIRTDDIIEILRGCIRNDYTFNPVNPISEEDHWYNKNPSLKDKIHCLVSVIPANGISLMNDEVIKQMREVRKRARDLGIPQAIIMTKVDEACPLVKANLEKVYTSRKIKKRVVECSLKFGVPESYIYPVRNYYEEDTTNDKNNLLILRALINIVHFADDYVKDELKQS